MTEPTMKTRAVWIGGLLTAVGLSGFGVPAGADPLDCAQTRQDNVNCLKNEVGDPAQLGTLYCGNIAPTCSEVGFGTVAKCGENSMWRVEGFVIQGVAQLTPEPFVGCNDGIVDSCVIMQGGRFCSSGTPEDANEGSLNCGVAYDPGETAEVDAECEDPPAPGKSGWLVRKSFRIQEDGAQILVSEVTQWLPPLDE